jgi:CBS domain containing-hemolysin-like protein
MGTRLSHTPVGGKTMLLLFITIAFSFGITFLCSLFEACLLSVSLTDIAHIQQKQPLVARIWLGFKKDIDKPISVILIINTLAHTTGAMLSGVQLEAIVGPQYIILFTIVFSFALIQWAEILPKTLGVKYNKSLAKISAVPLKAIINIFAPIVFVIHLLNRVFSGRKKTEKIDAIGEISVLAHFAQSDMQISKDQVRILNRALSLSRITIKDIMVKKADIKFLSTSMTLSQALIEAHLHHHTRFPLIEGTDTQKVLGFINFKDIVTALRINPADPTLKGIARPILSLSGEETISNALNRLTSGYQHIALVADSANELIGLITLENLLESIVGDVKDEYDILPSHCYKLSENRLLTGGGARLEEVNKTFNINLVEPDQTLSVWLLEKFGHLPAADDHIKMGDLEITVRKVSRSKIFEAVIDKIVAFPQ